MPEVSAFVPGRVVKSNRSGRVGAGNVPMIDWSKYADGQVYKLTAKVDFPEGKAATIGNSARTYGKSHGRRAVEYDLYEGDLYVRFLEEGSLPEEPAESPAASA